MIKYVPEVKRSREICLKAAKKNSEAIKHVPKKYLNVEICELVFEYPRYLEEVPRGIHLTILVKKLFGWVNWLVNALN